MCVNAVVAKRSRQRGGLPCRACDPLKYSHIALHNTLAWRLVVTAVPQTERIAIRFNLAKLISEHRPPDLARGQLIQVPGSLQSVTA